MTFINSCVMKSSAASQYAPPASKTAQECENLQNPANVITIYNFQWAKLCAQAKLSEDGEDFEQTKEYLRRALAVATEFSRLDGRLTQTLRNLVSLHYRLGEYNVAEKYALQEAEITHRTFGSNHLQSSASLNLLGAIYFAQESFAAAEMCFHQVLRVNLVFYGLEDRRTMNVAQSLAIVLAKQGKREMALQYFHQALKASEKIDDGQSLHRAAIVSQIASVR